MLASSLLLATTIAAFALWLQYHESRGWPEEHASQLDAAYRLSRFRRRGWIHNLMLVVAGLIAIAGFAGKGRLWVACWMIVMILLMVIILLAVADGFRTHRHHKNRLPEIRRETLKDE